MAAAVTAHKPAVIVAGIDLVSFLVVEKSRHVFQGCSVSVVPRPRPHPADRRIETTRIMLHGNSEGLGQRNTQRGGGREFNDDKYLASDLPLRILETLMEPRFELDSSPSPPLDSSLQ